MSKTPMVCSRPFLEETTDCLPQCFVQSTCVQFPEKIGVFMHCAEPMQKLVREWSISPKHLESRDEGRIFVGYQSFLHIVWRWTDIHQCLEKPDDDLGREKSRESNPATLNMTAAIQESDRDHVPFGFQRSMRPSNLYYITIRRKFLPLGSVLSEYRDPL